MNSPQKSANFHKNLEKGNIRIHNMLASMERTFLPVGSTIGKYRIIEEIDRGGMAVVYKVTQLDLDREVALKVMPANITINRRFVERFLSEAHAIAKLSHQNIVKIYEVAMENNIYYLAMEYIPGKNLYYYLNIYKPKLVDVLEIMSCLADALAYAHRQKIIHRDLKLNNVIMKDKLNPVLIDFGLAKAMENDEAGITRTGEIMGSPSYMAPERLLGTRVDHRSDICSLGIMLYEMLTFKNPYLDQRNLHQTTLNVMEANPIPPRKLVPWLPPEIEAITLKAMAKDPDHRYNTMEDFKADINRYQRGEPVLAQPPSFWWKARRFVKRHWAPLVIGSMILLFGTFFALYYYAQSKKEESHWQLVYSEKFSGRSVQEEWYFSTDSTAQKGDQGDDSSNCEFKDGSLQMNGKSAMYARLERRFNRDILIEFDVDNLNDKEFFNVGFFLFGDRPDSAYCFHINRNGNGESGISYPHSSFVFRDIDISQVILRNHNHVIIERMQNSISMAVNGIVVARVWDFLPPLGKRHEKVGFFVKGCSVSFDNMKVYRRAIPLVPSPSMIADRFWERGDFVAALEEYKGLQLDLSSSDIAKEIQVKIADCLVRQNNAPEALDVLDKCANLRSHDEMLQPRMYFLQGTIYNMLSNAKAADSIFRKLSIQYPSSPVNLAAMTSSILRIAGYNTVKDCESAQTEIEILSGQYPRHSDIWGALHLQILDTCMSSGKNDKALEIVEKVMQIHSKNNRILSIAKERLGIINLNKGNKDKAAEIFNQCISQYFSTPGVWESWMQLAGIFEYDFDIPAAIQIYQKIFRECPKTLLLPWMARLKMGELVRGDTAGVKRRDIFREVADAEYPFPLPRLVANYYLGEVNDSKFKEKWNELLPNDKTYFIFMARKAIFNGEEAVARVYLQDLKKSTRTSSWNFISVLKILNNLSHW